MEEKNITWKEIDEEMEKVVNEIAQLATSLVERLKPINEMIRQAPAPSNTEEEVIKSLCESMTKEILKTVLEYNPSNNMWTRSKDLVAAAYSFYKP